MDGASSVVVAVVAQVGLETKKPGGGGVEGVCWGGGVMGDESLSVCLSYLMQQDSNSLA